MNERLLTPSKITAWLECAHFLTLRSQADAGQLTIPQRPMGSLAELLVDKGAAHERDCLADFERQGRSIYQVPGRNPEETFTQWVGRIGNPMTAGPDVIYQMPFVHEGIRGIADFLVRVTTPGGLVSYEPIDAKLTRNEGRPGHVLQLCFYADAIAALTGFAPRQLHLWLGSGELESLDVAQFTPYWRRLRCQLSVLLNQEHIDETTPVPCTHCDVCEFQDHCERGWRGADSLVYVATIRPAERSALEAAGVRTVVALASRRAPVAELREENLGRLARQAALQVESREQPSTPPAFALLEPGDDPVYGHGFSLMPAPDDGDVFFDFEGHPFWTASHDLFFLAGLHLRDAQGTWSYDAIWAHDLDEQRTMIRALVQRFADRRLRFPGMHVYHYNHTERSSLERLTRGTESEHLFTHLVESGLFVDLYTVARNALQVGTESYGLKHLERLASFERSGDIDGGAAAVVEYEQWMKTRDPRRLADIARYNEDDVRATRALRDWLVTQRAPHLAWRDATLEVDGGELDTDELVASLQVFDPSSPEHLLGDLLNYWRREQSAYVTPKFVAAAADFATLYGAPDFIANLTLASPIEQVVNRVGNEIKRASFTWPEQSVGPTFKKQVSVLFTGVGIEHGYGYLSDLDLDTARLTMTWREAHDETKGVPAVVTVNEYVSPGPKPGVLFHLGEQVVRPRDDDRVSRVALALLERAKPRFAPGCGPANGVFEDDLESILAWVGHLDESFVAVQGPPGTGKTYSGSHIIYALIKSGKRVGITAMSHAAIDNLLEATHRLFVDRGELAALRVVRQGKRPASGALEGVRYASASGEFETTAFNLVAGTTWLWSRPNLRAYPVDVLVIDEAGQLALADAIASTNAARSLILLGDPLQLAHVAKAEHPNGSGASVLEHVLGGHPTIADTQGVFIAETRRMHPDVCQFLSNQIYEGRLTSHESCARQSTAFGTGLRWLEARHSGRSTESEEEAELVVAQIGTMLNTPWVNQEGESSVITARDFMVVAPYNDQVALIRRRMDRDPALREVAVGTVDKFQGREAPVVFFTMTTSTSDDMPRGPEFLFSRHRLNVAVSRARCLAYLVCTEELLNSRARTIDEMRLIGTLSAFVEYAARPR